MRIRASQIVDRKAFPTDAGSHLAKHVLETQGKSLKGLTIDVRGLPASMTISGFYNAFLQRVHEMSPELLPAARQVQWKVDFPFQETNVARWVADFQPTSSEAPSRAS